jgi:hypothetical protein
MSIPIGVFIDEGVTVIVPKDSSDTGATSQSGHNPVKAAVAEDVDENIGLIGPQISEHRPERGIREW